MRILSAILACAAVAVSAEGRHVEGNRRSPVRVVVYEDLACADCASFRRMMDETLLPKFAATAAFEHRDFPLPKHIWARRAAVAARHFERLSGEDGLLAEVEAGRSGRVVEKSALGVEWRRFALRNFREITDANFNEWLERFAREKGADPAEAVKALDDRELAMAVERDFNEGVARGIARTPTVLVNGLPFVEKFPVEEIVKAIEEAVRESGR